MCIAARILDSHDEDARERVKTHSVAMDRDPGVGISASGVGMGCDPNAHFGTDTFH
jgi:hypothetical protein